jgi:nitronate monooxygenase
MAKNPRLLDSRWSASRRHHAVVRRREAARRKIKRAGALMICQVQTVEQAKDARRTARTCWWRRARRRRPRCRARTFALVPAVVDAARGIPVAAAGGVADGAGSRPR